MKKLVLVLFFFAVGTILTFAQTVDLTTYGVSPRDVARDTVDQYFDLSYNSLKNVGTEAKVYLKGTSDVTFTSPTWNFSTKPAGSNATFGPVKDLDTSTQLITFIPDVAGTYVIEFSDGGDLALITINAAVYWGVEGGPVSCKTCHQNTINNIPDIYNTWVNTGHASDTKKAFDGELSSHFNVSCMPCHSTGYDLSAANDGFDDFPFVFPTVFQPGMYDSLSVLYPDAMGRANIQCEACHGPGSNHLSAIDQSKIDKSLSAEVCNACHDASGTHHVIGDQWKHSGHDATEFDGRGFHGGHFVGAFVVSADRDGCSPCHSGSGFVQWIKEGRPVDALGLPAATNIRPPAMNISCAVCHDPHDATNIHQLRSVESQLGDGTILTVEQYGTGTTCMTCHRSRRYAKTYASNTSNQSAHYGAHHGPQADMLVGKNAPDYGIEFPSSPHGVAGGNACVDCHMVGEKTGLDGNPLPVGGHTFNMNDVEGNDHVEACEPCHGNVGSSFKDKKYYINGNADLDRNGIAEGLQLEVHGLMEQLSTRLPHDANGLVSITNNNADSIALTPAIMRAGYVYIWIEEDRSFGIHNPAFTVALLKAAIEDLGGTVDIDFENNTPTSYSLNQNYPNPFNPSTTISFNLPEQAKVKVTIYDALGNQLEVIADDFKSAGTHNVTWNASNYASGIYFYRLEAGNFVQARKMILMK
ncbi:MAG: T9SS type A sorting domain-containing protein [Ignavibacteriales bacterium]|nr:T9SS type A sorting domain-containing protein [Ignavibacteriales bacterium]